MARGERPEQGAGDKFSPHTRGWPDLLSQYYSPPSGSPRTRGDGPTLGIWPWWLAFVLPAHAGMARHGHRARHRGRGSPRTRGDGPAERRLGSVARLRSPRTRGDGPPTKSSEPRSSPFSPHTRGWPVGPHHDAAGGSVLPAHAGMAR